jgi:hypothetical protein
MPSSERTFILAKLSLRRTARLENVRNNDT